MARRILGTSVATIERHYGKYIQSDAAEQPSELAGTVTRSTQAGRGRSTG